MENEPGNNSDQDQRGDIAGLMDDVDICKCKGCNVSYKSLLKHLGQKGSCHQAYSEQEMNHLKDAVKLAFNAKVRKRMKTNYQEEKQDILQKRKQHYQKNKQEILEKQKQYYQINKISINEKRSDHYHENFDKIVEKKAEYYLKNKEVLVVKIKQRQLDKKVQEQEATAEAVKGGNNGDSLEVQKEKDEEQMVEKGSNKGFLNDFDYDETNDISEFPHKIQRAGENNQNIIRKKKPITFTMDDLERDKEAEEDKEFKVKCDRPLTKKLQPYRKCTQ